MLASNFSLDKYLSHRSLGDVPGSRQPPFSVGISVSSPICPVMDFCCLSAGSVRFLILPFPTGEFGLPYGWLTRAIDHDLDLIGVITFRMCEAQSVRVPSLLRGLGILSCDFAAHRDRCPIHHRISRYDDHDVTQPRQGFTCVHPSDFLLARLPRSARSSLRRYLSLSTSPLPVSQREIGDSPGY